MKTFSCLIFLLAFSINANSQEITDSINIEGHYRTFHFFPPKQEIANRNIVFVLHGSGGNGELMIGPAAKLQAVADNEPLLLVYADGYKKYWNECRKAATSAANVENINEQAFFTAMLDYFGQRYKVNQQRFFAIGLSGGGHMCYKLAMTMPDKCRGICAVVANLPDTSNIDCDEAKKAVAVMIANGTADPLNHYEGGEIIIDGHSWGLLRSTQKTVQYWANLAAYKTTPTVKQLPDPDTTNGQSITQYTYKHGPKPEVILLEVKGGQHAFPKDVDIFTEAWALFKREIAREKRFK